MTVTVSRSRMPSDLNRLDRESGMLLATVDSLSEEEMRAPSRLPGWSRGHVVTHLARNADALRNVLKWARTGEESPAYACDEARDRDIEEGAGRPIAEIKADLTQAVHRLAQEMEVLRGDLAAEDVAIRKHRVPARALPSIRTTEVILHHDDLDTVWTLEEADPDAQYDAVEEALRRLRLHDDLPGVDIVTQEKDSWQLGGGGVRVTGSRAAVLAWLTRGATDHVSADAPLPSLPAFG